MGPFSRLAPIYEAFAQKMQDEGRDTWWKTPMVWMKLLWLVRIVVKQFAFASIQFALVLCATFPLPVTVWEMKEYEHTCIYRYMYTFIWNRKIWICAYGNMYTYIYISLCIHVRACVVVNGCTVNCDVWLSSVSQSSMKGIMWEICLKVGPSWGFACGQDGWWSEWHPAALPQIRSQTPGCWWKTSGTSWWYTLPPIIMASVENGVEILQYI